MLLVISISMLKNSCLTNILAGCKYARKYHNLSKTLPIRHSIKCLRYFSNTAETNNITTTIPRPVQKLRKALIVSKLTRWEFERSREPQLNDVDLVQKLNDRGIDVKAIMYYHKLHKSVETSVAKSFQNVGVEVQIVNRVTINIEKLKWADMVIPVGGDGTFLLAAGRASHFFVDKELPVVGFNSDPKRSEGRLVLPKQYTFNIDDAVKRLLTGNYKFMKRSRIRITLLGANCNTPRPVDLHEFNEAPVDHKEVFVPGPKFLNLMNGCSHRKDLKRMLPYLALNEVFIGEKLSARVSHLHIRADNTEKVTKTKSSGLCVSTGTGSTSWHTSINRLSKKNVEELLKILHLNSNYVDKIDAESISDNYNKQLVFPPDDPRLCYSIREQICVGVWPNPKGFESRNFAKNVFVKSRCVDASLVIDGSIAYPFNDGTKVLLEVHPEDALLTLTMD